MDRCFASSDEYDNALQQYLEKQKRVDQEDRKHTETNEEDYNLIKEIDPSTIYNKYEIYSIATHGNAAYHFCAKFKSKNGPELLLSHQNSGASLLKIYEGPPTYSHNSVTLIKKGDMMIEPNFRNIFMIALLWWYKNDIVERTRTYPGSCSGLVSCVISHFVPNFKSLVQNNDTYLEQLSKSTLQNLPKAVSANLNYKNLRSGSVIKSPKVIQKKKSLSFKNKSGSKTKSVKKVKKSTKKVKKSTRKVKKSTRKSKKVKKSTRKSKKVKKSTKKVKKSSRKSVRKSVRKVKSRK